MKFSRRSIEASGMDKRSPGPGNSHGVSSTRCFSMAIRSSASSCLRLISAMYTPQLRNQRRRSMSRICLPAPLRISHVLSGEIPSSRRHGSGTSAASRRSSASLRGDRSADMRYIRANCSGVGSAQQYQGSVRKGMAARDSRMGRSPAAARDQIWRKIVLRRAPRRSSRWITCWSWAHSASSG